MLLIKRKKFEFREEHFLLNPKIPLVRAKIERKKSYLFLWYCQHFNFLLFLLSI